jgi:hypothetical protein
MSLTPTVMGDNAQVPGISAVAYRPDQLIADSRTLISDMVVLGAGTYKRGQVFGLVSVAAVEAAPGAANVGNGSVGALASKSQNAGAYTLTATSATEFAVASPEGVALGVAKVGAAFTSADIALTVSAGATAFAPGDVFTVTVFDAAGIYVPSVRTATDGSQDASAILADDVTLAVPAKVGAYFAGEFNLNALIHDDSWSPSLLAASLRKHGIYAKSSISAAAPVNNSAP